MDKEKFIEWFCPARDCVRSTGITNFYNIRRILRMGDPKAMKIPKNHTWLTKKIDDQIAELDRVPRKNLFAALVGYLRALKAPDKKIDKYSKLMNSASKQVDEFYESQTKTDRQNKNWIEMADIKRFFKEIKAFGHGASNANFE